MYLEQMGTFKEIFPDAIADAEQRQAQWVDAVLLELQMMQRFKAAKLSIAKKFKEHQQRQPALVKHPHRSLKWVAWFSEKQTFLSCFRSLQLAEKDGNNLGSVSFNDDNTVAAMLELIVQSKTVLP